MTLILTQSKSDFDYCQLKCHKYTHTMCLYKGVSKKCEDFKESNINDEAKKIIVDKHNEMRRCIANGTKYKPGHPEMPKAANMMKLEWSEESARVAQRWADQCTYEHDQCRKLKSMDNGQNMARLIGPTPFSAIPYVKFLESFYNEIMKFKVSLIDKYHPEGGIGHFSQEVWAETQYIGCGASFYSVSGLKKKYYAFLVCNYGPRGNLIKAPLYKKGEPCSACPNGTICEDGLCAVPRAVELTTPAGKESFASPEVTTILPTPAGTQHLVPQKLSTILIPSLYYISLKYIFFKI